MGKTRVLEGVSWKGKREWSGVSALLIFKPSRNQQLCWEELTVNQELKLSRNELSLTEMTTMKGNGQYILMA